MVFFNGFSNHITKWVQSRIGTISYKNVYEMMLFRIGGYFIHLTVGAEKMYRKYILFRFSV